MYKNIIKKKKSGSIAQKKKVVKCFIPLKQVNGCKIRKKIELLKMYYNYAQYQEAENFLKNSLKQILNLNDMEQSTTEKIINIISGSMIYI